MEEHSKRQLEAAIAVLYATFARYPFPQMMRTRWGTLLSREGMRLLTSWPLDKLGWGELGRYVYKAMSLWGDADDYRHFLPRLLELLVEEPPEPHTAVNEAVVLYNVRDEWRTWPAGEQEAIEGYLAALWRYILSDFDPARPLAFVQDAPCLIAQVIDDLEPYLALYEERAASSLAHLARYININSDTLLRGAGLSNTYWSERTAQVEQVVSWLLSPLPLALLEEGYLAHPAAPFAHELAAAADALRVLRGGGDN